MGFSLPYLRTIAFLFVSAIIVPSSGELVVVREPLSNHSDTMELTCISEDDDSALIWNYNLNETMPNFRKNIITDFEPKKPVLKSISKCAMWNFSGCSTGWGYRSGWDVVNSALRPMGPVLDYRWEDLREFVFEKDLKIADYQYVGKVNESSLTTVFSVRGLRDIYIFLCDKKDPMLGSCLWIILGGWGNTQSAIRLCDKAPDPRTPPSNINCKDIFLVKHEVGKIVQLYEWRTFTLKWINQTKTIQVFRETDHEHEPFLQGNLAKWKSVSHVSIKSGIETRVRHHFYEYWLTERENSTLNTKAFDFSAEHFCVEVLVGLCPECKLNFRLIDSKGYDLNIMTSISGNRKSVYNELLTWESIELKMDVKNLVSKSVKLAITTILKTNGGKGQWAIDKFRTCRPVGGIRKSNITIHRDSLSGSWLQVNCQKLSHNRKQNAVVNSLSKIMNDEDINQSQPFLEKWIRSGGSSGKNVDKGWSFCNSIGCMCTQGFMGNNCNESELCLKGIPVGDDHLKVITSSHSKGCRALRKGSYSLEVHDLSGNMSQAPFFDPVFPYDIKNLRPYTKYKLILLNTQKNMVWTAKVRTLPSAPGKVLNLRHGKVSDKEVTLKWGAPKETNGIITKYTVSIQRVKLLGCENLKRPTPPAEELEDTVEDTTAFISGLHPYAIYKVVVIAYTIKPGPEESWEFETSATALPTSVVSNLRLVNNQTRLEWDKPEDCTKISGLIETKILTFASPSSWAEKWQGDRQTIADHFDLNEFTLLPCTSYTVRIYLARGNDWNLTPNLYQKISWTTPPSARPAIKNLVLYEANVDTNTFSLRGVPPYPPCGEIESYHVSITSGNRFFRNQTIEGPGETLMCEFLEDHICFENLALPADGAFATRVQVYGKNKDVGRTAPLGSLTFVPNLSYDEAPSNPQNLKMIYQDHGLVVLKWTQPSTPSTITKFQINVRILTTVLLINSNTQFLTSVNYLVAQRQKYYNVTLALSPSTRYLISVMAVNGRNKNSSENEREFSTPASVGFVSEKEPRVQFNQNSIETEIPTVVNATKNTTVKVIVEGLSTCTPNESQKSLPLANLMISVMKWEAAVYQVGNNTPESLKIFTGQNQGVTSNCSLHLNGTYTILFIVTDLYSNKSTELRTSPINLNAHNLAWLTIFPVLAACVLALFIWYRFYRNRERAPTPPKRPRRPRPPSYLEILPPLVAETTLDASTTPNLPLILIPLTAIRAGENQSSAHLYTVPNEADSCTVSVEYFEEYAKQAAAGGHMYSQFMLLRKGLKKPCEYGKLPENMPKNRCGHLIPYDDTRVVLEKTPGDPYSDYINASYIKGYEQERAYIAAQGPKPSTTNDFWRMIWQEKVHVICMLTNLFEGTETKCEKYWPETGTRAKYGDFLVSNTDNQVFADYTFRTLEMNCNQGKRKITHLHYTGWPSFGVPTYPQSFVAYLKELRKKSPGNGPVVVHCSTGDDRTGTIILCDICLSQAVAKKEIDVTAVITRMRDSRANMVGTLQQYLLAHIIITESLVALSTQIPCNKVLLERVKKMKMHLRSDMQRLQDTAWQEHALRSFASTQLSPTEDTANNRSQHLNAHSNTISETRDEAVYSELFDTQSSQFHAVSVDSVRVKKQYLASWLPTPSTLSDFWRLIAKKNIELIIILQCSDPSNPTCCDIMPDKSIVAPRLNIAVENRTDLHERKYFTYEKLLLTDTSEENAETQCMTVLTCKGWGRGGKGKPPTPAALVSLWIASEKIPRKAGRTLVLCHDGITGCGLYLALSFLLEWMEVEKECDVISAVRAVRRSRSKFVQSKEQFEFLYDSAVNYVKYCQTHANIS